MHVLVWAAFFTPHENGISAYIRSYAKALKAHGVKTTVVTFDLGGLPGYEEIDDIAVHRLPSRTILGGTQVIPRWGPKYDAMMKNIDRLDIDVVMTHTRFFPTTQIGTRYAKTHGIPLVHVEHGNRHVPHPNPLVRLGAWLYDHTLGRWTMKRAAAVIAISPQGRKFCQHLGAHQDKCYYIPNSIDTRRFRRVRSKVREELDIPENAYVIAYVGRLIHAKGVQDLIRAVSGMRHTHMVIVGDGNYRSELEVFAKQAKTPIHFLGEVQRDEVRRILSTADLFVNPSYAEGLPTSVLEAAAMGLPTLATDVGGTPQILPREQLVEPRDTQQLGRRIRQARKALANEDLRAQAIKRHVREEFDVSENAKRIKNVLDRLL